MLNALICNIGAKLQGSRFADEYACSCLDSSTFQHFRPQMVDEYLNDTEINS